MKSNLAQKELSVEKENIDTPIVEKIVSPEKEQAIVEEPLVKKESFFFNEANKPQPSRRQVHDTDSTSKHYHKKLFFLGFGVFIATIMFSTLFGILFMQIGNTSKKETPKSKSEPISVSPTPVPAVLKREQWTFEVLNGSGEAGVAAKGAEKLKTLGYEVDKTGNADDNVTTTQLYISKDKTDEETKLLIDDLKSDFGDLTVTGVLSDSTASVRIILPK